MSDRTQQHQSEQERTTADSTQSSPSMGPSNAHQVDRIQAIQQLNMWLEGQQTRLATTSVMMQMAESNGVLQALETAWANYQRNGYLQEMPLNPGRSFNRESAGIFLPTELASNIRPFIEMTETARGANAESSSSGVDWNTRLGIPEYRTQSDNLVAPEASCNVTTLAMILERMGIGRNDVIMALERRMNIGVLDNQESRDDNWIDTTMDYLNRQMRASAPYQRVRGEASMSTDTREGLASGYRDNAQMEDLLDLLLHEMGQSRTAVVSEPERLLQEVSFGRATPTTEKLWESRWDRLAPQVEECLENGGGAALSFKHKGNRSNATHIVSILAVESDGFRIDDPYGDMRDDYNRRAWDDAYWGRNDDGNLIASRDRSDQRNVIGDVDDWGTSWARDLPEEESRGQESFISSDQVRRSMFYVQLFHRGEQSTSSLLQGSGTDLAPTRSLIPVARGPRFE